MNVKAMPLLTLAVLLGASCAEPTGPDAPRLVAQDGTQSLYVVERGATRTLILRDNGKLVGVTKITSTRQGATVEVTPVGRPTTRQMVTHAQLAGASFDYDSEDGGRYAGDEPNGPFGCNRAGQGLLLAVASLVISTATGNPLGVFVSTLGVASALSFYAACKEYYAQNPGAP